MTSKQEKQYHETSGSIDVHAVSTLKREDMDNFHVRFRLVKCHLDPLTQRYN